MHKLICCWFFIIFVSLFVFGSLSFAQGRESSSSGWEKAHKESLAKVEAADKEVMVKAETEAMAMAAMVKAEEAMAKAEKAAAKAEAAMSRADESMAKAESTAKAEEEAVIERKKKHAWEFWK